MPRGTSNPNAQASLARAICEFGIAEPERQKRQAAYRGDRIASARRAARNEGRKIGFDHSKG